MGSAGYLDDLATSLLAEAFAALAAGRTGVTAPAKTYVAHGDPVADFDGCCGNGQDDYGGGILTVHLGAPTADPIDFSPPDRTQGCHRSIRVRYTITLLRCVPALNQDGTAPAAAALDASAGQLAADLWCLVTGVLASVADDTWPGTPGASCRDVLFEDVITLEPEGGCAGWQVVVSAVARDAGPPDAS